MRGFEVFAFVGAEGEAGIASLVALVLGGDDCIVLELVGLVVEVALVIIVSWLGRIEHRSGER